LDELIALLEMEELLTKPVRNFSLGERMKCELVAGLLHRPDVLFLDEPTLGLDVSMQARLRRFLAEYNRRSGVTVILTSHYMADVVALCPRVILIHHGNCSTMARCKGWRKTRAVQLIRLTLRNGHTEEEILRFAQNDGENAEVMEQENGQVTLRVSRAATPAMTARLLNTLLL
jgi:ABC-2 type transport system ATP-binding protein